MTTPTNNSSAAAPTISQQRFREIWDEAIAKYQEQSGIKIAAAPSDFDKLDSVEAVHKYINDKAKEFTAFRDKGQHLRKVLRPFVNTIGTFAMTLAEGVGLPFDPAKPIFLGVGELIKVANKMSTDYDSLAEVIDRLRSVLERIKIHVKEDMEGIKEVHVQLLAQVLVILGTVTKKINDGRFKTFFKELLKSGAVASALQKLDKLVVDAHATVSSVGLDMNFKVLQMLAEILADEQAPNKEVRVALRRINSTARDIYEIRRNSELSLNETLSFRALLEDIQKQQSDFYWQLQKGQDNTDIKNILNWLIKCDPKENLNEANRKRLSGTGSWFLDSNASYQKFREGRLPFLWIQGDAGTGKTIMLAAIIQDVQQLYAGNSSSFLAYHFFDFTAGESKQNL